MSTMTTTRKRASDELIAELNAGLHARDPMRIMKHQIRLKTLGEVRQRLSNERVTLGDAASDPYLHVEGILDDLERHVPA